MLQIVALRKKMGLDLKFFEFLEVLSVVHSMNLRDIIGVIQMIQHQQLLVFQCRLNWAWVDLGRTRELAHH